MFLVQRELPPPVVVLLVVVAFIRLEHDGGFEREIDSIVTGVA